MENGRDGFMQYLKEEAERVRKERVASRLPRATLGHGGESGNGGVSNSIP
jgi:putative component of toxin-antitoxin plasmid stabilization module